MIILDGKPIEEYGLYPLKGHTHPLPNHTSKTMKIPGRPGLWYFGSELGVRSLNQPVGILRGNPADTQRKLNDFIRSLFDDFGKPREIELIYDYEPDKHYTVKFDGSIDPQRIHEYTEFNLPLTAFDPYKYSNAYGDEVTWGNETITFEYNYLLGREGLNGSVQVTSQRTLDVTLDGLAVQPIFEISGTANGLTISANGYSFVLPNFANTDWVIDFEDYTVHKNGAETMLDIKEFYLLPGDNAVNITGSNINLDMRIKFRDKYM